MRLLLLSATAALSVPGTHKRPIRIAPGLEVTVLEADEGKPGGVHTVTVTWSGGRALAGYLSEQPELVRGKRVVEIGAGCGLVSLTCCALGADGRATCWGSCPGSAARSPLEGKPFAATCALGANSTCHLDGCSLRWDCIVQVARGRRRRSR